MRNLLAAITVLVASASWLLWPATVAPPVAVFAHEPSADEAGRPAVDSAAVERRELELPPVIDADEAGEASPWRLCVRVFDAANITVAGATVSFFGGELARLPAADEDGNTTAWLGRADGPPLLSRTTDAEGECEVMVRRRRVYVVARHPDCGRSVAHGVEYEDTDRDDLFRVHLARPVLVRGLVLGSDDRPVPFAAVRVEAPAGSAANGDIVTDARGAFRFEADLGAPCSLWAMAGDRRSRWQGVVAGVDAGPMLRIGAPLRPRGRVVDALGAPLPGAEVHWRAAGATRGRWQQTGCDAAGEFTMTVDGPGDYLVGAFDAWQARAVTVEQVSVLPVQQQTIILQLHPATPIRGRAVDAEGIPLRGGRVYGDAGDCVASRSAVFADLGKDGSFALAVPEHLRWNLQGWAGDLTGGQDRVAAGATGVELVLRPRLQVERLCGSVVASDGTPVEPFEVLCLDRESLRERVGAFTVDGNRFASTSLPEYGDWVAVVRAADRTLMPARIDDLVPGRPRQSVVVTLGRAGELRLRVVDRFGRRFGRVILEARSDQWPQQWLCPDGRTQRPGDAEGRAEFKVIPGRVIVRVWRSFELLAEREVEVMPGANAEVVVPVGG